MSSGGRVFGPPPEMDRLRRERAESLDAHTTFPEFRSLMAGSDGALWVEDHPLPGASAARWYRLMDGAPTGWLELPTTTELIAAGHGLVVLLTRDELNVETVIVSRVGR